MSLAECRFLEELNVRNVMYVFEKQALFNEQADPKLKVCVDKYLTQILRIILANTAGKYQLTQEQWSRMMSPYRGRDNIIHRSPLEKIYDQHIRPYSQRDPNWKEVSKMINWLQVREDLSIAAAQIERPQFLNGFR